MQLGLMNMFDNIHYYCLRLSTQIFGFDGVGFKPAEREQN